MNTRQLLSIALLTYTCTSVLANESGTDWPSFANDIGGSQYSELNEINTQNVAELELAWTHRSGDFIADGENGTSLQVTPIHANGLLYFCTPMNRVFALDPDTGTEKWVFDPHHADVKGEALTDKGMVPAPCRGVAYWAGAIDNQSTPQTSVTKTCQRRIFKADIFAQIYAIDADTGAVCADFGKHKGHPGFISLYDYESHGEGYRGLTSPPLIVGDLIVVGSGSNDGLANPVDGIVRAFDVRTGVLKWAFNAIPQELRNRTGAANVWSLMSGDEDNGLVFLPTTSPATDYFGGERLFDIPLADAVVALDINNGKVKWSFQTVRHDLFDYDLPGHALLVTIQKDGQAREVAIQQTKMGFIFVFDRLTGEPIFPIKEIPAPASTLAEETAALTQPVPQGIDPFANQILGRKSMFGLTPLDRGWCRDQFDKLAYAGLYTPPSAEGTILFPSALGGGNWGGAAFDPARNLLIIKSENLATRIKLVSQKIATDAPTSYLTRPLEGTPYRVEGELFMSPLGIPCTPPPWGTLSAVDMNSGKLQWQIPLGQVKRYGITVPASLGWGSPNIGGPIITAGGLIFVAGTMDEKIRALDIGTGEELWQAKLPIAATAVPMTYRGADGNQYVVIAAGGSPRAGTGSGDYLYAFKLP